MNSLNFLSAKVIGQPVTRPRSKSQGNDLRRKLSEELLRGRSYSADKVPQIGSRGDTSDSDVPPVQATLEGSETPVNEVDEDEKQLLLQEGKKDDRGFQSRLHLIVKKIADAITAILATIGMPVVYVAKQFRDESGHYSALGLWRQ